jgi:agmatinase
MPADPPRPANISAIYGAASGGTFLGLPAASIAEGANADVALFGAATATPYPGAGAYCANAPAAIRAGIANWAGAREHVDFDFGEPIFPAGVRAVDCGDLPIDTDDHSGNREKIRAATKALLDGGAVPVLLGGDDSVPIPFFEAFEGRGEFAILQIDAHIDWRDELHGTKFGLSSPMRRASEMRWVKHLVQVGARGLSSARAEEVRDARAAGAVLVTAREIAAHGVQRAIDAIPAGANLIVTLDCDGLDPTVIPGVIGRAPGGLTYWQTVELLHGAAKRARIAAFDIVEFVPERDVSELGALAAARLVVNALGLIARQRQR